MRARGEHHLRMATLLTGNLNAAEDLVQASLLNLYRVWSRIDTSAEPDAYLQRIIVNKHRSWWRARWRQETPVAEVPEAAAGEDSAERHAVGALVRQALARLPRGSAPCWCCGTGRTCRKPTLPRCWAVRPAKPRYTEREASSGPRKRYRQRSLRSDQQGRSSRGTSTQTGPSTHRPYSRCLKPAPGSSMRDRCPARAGPAPGTGFAISHPEGTAGVVDSITRTVDVDKQGHVRSLTQTTVFSATGKPGGPGESIYTLEFTFSDFGLRFSVIPPPARQIDPNSGVAVQF
jgi:Sigma-70 region 2